MSGAALYLATSYISCAGLDCRESTLRNTFRSRSHTAAHDLLPSIADAVAARRLRRSGRLKVGGAMVSTRDL